MVKAAFLSFLAAMSIIADIAAGADGTLLGQGLIATVLGFLGWFVKSWLADMRAEVKALKVETAETARANMAAHLAESKALRLEIAENTRVQTVAMLEIAALIPGARGILEAAHKGAEERIAAAKLTA